VNVPADVGVPVRFGPTRARPGGNAPFVTLKVGPGEPLAVYTCAYDEPNVPFGGAALVNAGPETGTTLTVPEAALLPTPFVAVTEHAYVVPAARPDTVIGEAAPVPVRPPGLQVAVYPVIAEPPFEAGGVKLMEAWLLPGVAEPMVGAPGTVAAIVIEKFCVAVPAELVAVTTPVKVPLAFGVPESVPADELRVSPPGNAPEVRLKVGAGEPLAANVCEYAELNVPPGAAPLVNAGTDVGVTFTLAEAALEPTALFALTEQDTGTPPARPVTVMGEAGPCWLCAPQVAVKLVIADPPFDAGAVNATVAEFGPGVPAPMVGAPGTEAPIVIAMLIVHDPPELVAVTTLLNVPPAFGVPVIAPLVVLSERPPGRAPELSA